MGDKFLHQIIMEPSKDHCVIDLVLVSSENTAEELVLVKYCGLNDFESDKNGENFKHFLKVL